MAKAESISLQTVLGVLPILLLPSLQPTPSDSSLSTYKLIFVLLAGLVVLLIAMVLVIVYLLKMFKRRF